MERIGLQMYDERNRIWTTGIVDAEEESCDTDHEEIWN